MSRYMERERHVGPSSADSELLKSEKVRGGPDLIRGAPQET